MASSSGSGGSTSFFWGDTPEAEYYASQGVRNSQSFFQSPHGRLFTQSWLPASAPSAASTRGLVFCTHGYGSDTGWMFQRVCIPMAQWGYAVYAADLLGHGRSEGLPGYVESVEATAEAALSYYRAVRDEEGNGGLRRFLVGESMGGGLTFLMLLQEQEKQEKERKEKQEKERKEQKEQKEEKEEKKEEKKEEEEKKKEEIQEKKKKKEEEGGWDGAVLLAPLLVMPAEMTPSPLRLFLYSLLLGAAEPWAVMPAPNVKGNAFRDPAKARLVLANPRRYKQPARVGTMRQLRRLCSIFLDRCGEVRTPLLALHGTGDNITAHEGSRILIDRAASPDKTLKLYDGCFHSLVQAELDSNAALVLSDIKAWLDARTPPPPPPPSSSA